MMNVKMTKPDQNIIAAVIGIAVFVEDGTFTDIDCDDDFWHPAPLHELSNIMVEDRFYNIQRDKDELIAILYNGEVIFIEFSVAETTDSAADKLFVSRNMRRHGLYHLLQLCAI